MSVELMNTKEVASYLDIHEKQVYALIKSGRIPASRATGKWIFPKKIIDAWIESQAGAGLREARQKGTRIEGALLAAGSNDPILDMLLATLKSSHPDFYIFTASTGSTDGLKALGRGYTDVAWSHLFDPASGRYNTPAVLSPYIAQLKGVVIHLFNRELGLLVPKGNPLHLHGFDDLRIRKPRLVNRQPGAGTRILLDHYLQKAGAAPDSLSGYRREVFTHMEVGLAILSGEADTGLASAAVARLLGLDFIPLATESFDMILDQATFFVKGLQAFLDGLQSQDFQQKVAKLGGYDFKNAGRVVPAVSDEDGETL
jgi:putative molybdopterin biosynthesis protein